MDLLPFTFHLLNLISHLSNILLSIPHCHPLHPPCRHSGKSPSFWFHCPGAAQYNGLTLALCRSVDCSSYDLACISLKYTSQLKYLASVLAGSTALKVLGMLTIPAFRLAYTHMHRTEHAPASGTGSATPTPFPLSQMTFPFRQHGLTRSGISSTCPLTCLQIPMPSTALSGPPLIRSISTLPPIRPPASLWVFASNFPSPPSASRCLSAFWPI